MKQQLDSFLQSQGYNVIPSNLPEFTIYYQNENNYVNVIHLVEDREDLYLEKDQFRHVKDTIYKLFKSKGYYNVHILSIIISTDMEKVKRITNEDTFCWMIEPIEKKLIIYENQVSDFYGAKTKIEDCLLRNYKEYVELEGNTEVINENSKKFIDKGLIDLKKRSYITIGITVINILMFLICTFTGDLLYNIGALNVIRVFYNGEFYRIITSMFLHADVNHLFSNMVIFYFFGDIVEKSIGHIKYLFLYFIAGIGGGLLSMEYSSFLGNYVDSVGASGAIFGIIGALLWLVISHKGRLGDITLGKILFLIIYSLYSGFTATNIDNAAHIGGLIVGFLFTLIVRRIKVG